ncbi:MAG: PAS domain-containing sensor histidine kinase [Phycisphaerae bacterium]
MAVQPSEMWVDRSLNNGLATANSANRPTPSPSEGLPPVGGAQVSDPQGLRARTKRAQAYLGLSGAFVFAQNPQGEITYINRDGCEALGYTEEELLGKNWVRYCVSGEDRARVSAGLARLMAGEFARVEYSESCVQTKSGAHRLIAWHHTVLTDRQGRVIGTLSSGTDVADGRPVRGRDEAHQEELERLSLMSTLGEMSITIAHELSQPLMAIANYAEACKLAVDELRAGTDRRRGSDMTDPRGLNRVTEDLREIIAQADRAGEIIRRLRAFASRREPTWSPLDFHELTREVVDFVASEARLRGVRLQLELAAGDAMVRGEHAQLRHVILQLLRSAVTEGHPDSGANSGRENGNRVVTLRTMDGTRHELEVTVTDADQALDGLHDRRRSPTPRKSVPDAAPTVGNAGDPEPHARLAISEAIIEAHGGRLWVAREGARGMMLRFTLPHLQRDPTNGGDTRRSPVARDRFHP